MGDRLLMLCGVLEEEYGFDSDDLFISERNNRVVVEKDVDSDAFEGIEEFGATVSSRRNFDGRPCLKVFDEEKLRSKIGNE